MHCRNIDLQHWSLYILNFRVFQLSMVFSWIDYIVYKINCFWLFYQIHVLRSFIILWRYLSKHVVCHIFLSKLCHVVNSVIKKYDRFKKGKQLWKASGLCYLQPKYGDFFLDEAIVMLFNTCSFPCWTCLNLFFFD